MGSISEIYNAIANNGFAEQTLQRIDEYINEIQNGTRDFPRYNFSEHAGLCKAGPVLIGASVIASYATRSLTASCHAEGCEGGPTNWQIDELQEQLIEQWAKASKLWVEKSDQILTKTFGPLCYHGAEAKVYYREGDKSVVKEQEFQDPPMRGRFG